jgi:Fe-S-cluster containining protein
MSNSTSAESAWRWEGTGRERRESAVKRLKLLEELFQEMDELAAKALSKSPREITCKKGCSACCYMMTTILAGEGLLLAREVSSRLDWRYRLRRLASAARANRRVVDRATYLQSQIPCPFLEKGECSVYRQRPAACRYYYVVSPASWCSGPPGTQVLVVNLMEQGLDIEARTWKLQEDLWGVATAPLPIMVLHCLDIFMKGREKEKELKWALRGVPNPVEWMAQSMEMMKTAHDEETDDVRQAILGSSRRVGLI